MVGADRATMTHHMSNHHNKAVGDTHAARELIVAPCRLKVDFGLWGWGFRSSVPG
jgi:hypothetical protein